MFDNLFPLCSCSCVNHTKCVQCAARSLLCSRLTETVLSGVAHSAQGVQKAVSDIILRNRVQGPQFSLGHNRSGVYLKHKHSKVL